MSMSSSSNNNADDVSSSSLLQQLATRLINGNPPTQHPLKPMKTCIAIAGGGSTASSTIASTSGASSLLLESIVTYDRRSFAEFVTTNQNDLVTTNDETENELMNSSKNFSFCSNQAAILLAQSALSRSIQLSPKFQDRALHCVGVGCASALVGNAGDGGGRVSKAHVALSTLRSGTKLWEIELENYNDGVKCVEKRSRGEEEKVVSNLVLALMIEFREELDEEDCDSLLRGILDRNGDGYEVKCSGGGRDVKQCSPAEGARQIIEGKANIVSIMPVANNIASDMDSASQSFRMETAFADHQIPFPNEIVIVPGSYNPPHHGHVGLANAAVAALRKIRQREEKEYNDSSSNTLRSRYSSLESFSTVSSSSSSSVLKNLWDKIDKHDYDPTVLFEMSVTNPDKPPMNPTEVERRMNFFPTLSNMPQDWGVILTNAPLFSTKTSLLDEVLNGSSPFSNRRMTFVLGTDTMVRIINPKYYDNSFDNMIDALVGMKEKGVHFIVGGRLEQTGGGSRKFINGKEEVESLPDHVQDMFTLLTEDEFRLDVSSTEIRKQMMEQQ